MRCQKCEQRNSVAANKCRFCGNKFKKKELSLKAKVFSACLLTLLAGAGAVAVMLPKFADPSENLAACAKRVAAGPKSAEDARYIKGNFDNAIKAVLERFGDESSGNLAARLQRLLPSSAFEVHVIDLPRGLKLVEIDTLLQATDFLVMKGTTDTKVFFLPGFEVFDDARTVSDQAGPILVLVGHSSGQLPHKPQVRTYALLPDFIVDETDKMVPIIKGEGCARFIGKGADIAVELSLASMAKEENIAFSLPVSADVVIKQKLRWKDAKYSPQYEIGHDADTYLFMLGRCLSRPELVALTPELIGEQATRMIKEAAGDGLGAVCVSAPSSKRGGNTFLLKGKGKELVVSLANQSNRWTVDKYAAADTAGGASPGQTSTPATPVFPNLSSRQASLPEAPSGKSLLSMVAADRANDNKPSIPEPPNSQKIAIGTPDTAAGTKGVRQDKVADASDRKPPQPGAAVQAPESDTAGAHHATVVCSTSIHLRERPAPAGNTLCEIPKGAKLSVLGKENGWYRVVYGGKSGYVYGGLLEFPRSTARSDSAVYTTAVVTRSIPVQDEQKRPLATPRAGDRLVVVSGIRNNKYKVQLADGRIGYLDKGALDVKVDTPELVP